MVDKRGIPLIVILCCAIILPDNDAATSGLLPVAETDEQLLLQEATLELLRATETDVSPQIIQAAKADLAVFLNQVIRIMPPAKSIDRSQENSDKRMDAQSEDGQGLVAPHLLETATDALAEFLAKLTEIVPPAMRATSEKNEASTGVLPEGEPSPQVLDALANALSDLVEEITNSVTPVRSINYQLEPKKTSNVTQEADIPPEVVETVASVLVDVITQISHSRPVTSALPSAASNATDTGTATSSPRPVTGISPKVLEALANALVDIVSQMPSDDD